MNSKSSRSPLLIPTLVVISVALVARWLSWPGFATHDTLFITREAMEGQYTTYHPILNALLLRVLAVPFHSYALYTSLQIALCATLLIRSIALAARHTGRQWPAMLTVAIWALAAHTVLYLGIIWKDVPIAYCLCFIAAIAYRVRISPELPIKRIDALLFGVSVFLCVGLRHGMSFNLVLVPLVIGLARLKRERRLWAPFLLAVTGIVVCAAIAHSSLVKNDKAHFLKLKISAISQPFLGVVTNINGYSSDDYGFDGALATRVFGNSYAKEYSPDYFRNQVVLEDADELQRAYRAIIRRTPRLCALNVSLCVSGRIQMMLGTMQPSTKFGGMTFYDLGALPNCPTVFGMGEDQCKLLEQFETSEKPASALRSLQWMNSRLVEERGTINNLLVWNLFPALLLLGAVLLLLTPRSPLWLVAAFFALESLLPFATAMANDFRYYYFLFPFFAVFAPVALFELMRGRRPGVAVDRRVERAAPDQVMQHD